MHDGTDRQHDEYNVGRDAQRGGRDVQRGSVNARARRHSGVPALVDRVAGEDEAEEDADAIADDDKDGRVDGPDEPPRRRQPPVQDQKRELREAGAGSVDDGREEDQLFRGRKKVVVSWLVWYSSIL